MSHARTPLLKLGEELLADPIANANHVSLLLAAATEKEAPEETRKAALRALNLFFADSLQRGEFEKVLGEAHSGDSPRKAHYDWLRRQHDIYTALLLQLLSRSESPGLQVAAFNGVLDLSRGPKEKPFLSDLFTIALEIILCSDKTSAELLAALTDHYLQFVDVRFYVFRTIHALASRASKSQSAASPSGNSTGLSKAALRHLPLDMQVSQDGLARVIHAVLWKAKPLTSSIEASSSPQPGTEEGEPGAPAAKSWCGALETGALRPVHTREGAKHLRKRQKLGTAEADGDKERAGAKWVTPTFQRAAFSDAWLSFLCLPLPEDLYRKVLTRMHEDVIPHLVNPHLLADLLSGALEAGGLLGMLALHAIFVLVTRHGLEYPAFYSRLYQLLQPSVFYAKQRGRFFQLADVFLSSGLVPAYTVAAFIKRFARLSILAPPAGCLVCLAFVHNLLRRHPACVVMIDRQSASDAEGEAPGRDPYREEEEDPANSQAVNSSLWELKTLSNHYYPQVAAAAKQILEKDLTDRKKTAEMNLGLLVSGSYTSIATAELARRIRQVPTAFYQQPPEKLFDQSCTSDFPGWVF